MADISELNFDAEQIQPQASFEPVPVGEYTVMITESDLKPTKSGDGRYLQLVYDILEGDYKGRKIWDRLNLVNKNVTATEIAQRALSAICHAVGVLHPKQSEELHNKPFVVKVGIRPASGDFCESNTIKGYSSIKTKQSNPPGAKRPWEKSE
jgi:hypothetical protein